MAEDAPASIGRYIVERLLGEGAMGRVFLARDPELDRHVAIKTLKQLDLAEEARTRFLKRFHNEARAAARVQHPNIVQVYDVGEEEGVGPYLVFEYVRGETLKEVLRRRGALPLEEVCGLVTSLAGGLDTAHEAKIIHRDIKPDNILITADGQPKLADFGVARVPNATLTREGQFLGTPAYAAPETLGHGQASPRSDLFSLASVVFEAITGRRAFPGQGAVEVAHRVIHEEPPPVSRVTRSAVPRALDAVIARGLSKTPSARFGSATEFAAAIVAAAAGRSAARSSAAAPGGAWAPLLVVGLGGALIITAIFASLAPRPVTTPDGGDAGRSGDAAPRAEEASAGRSTDDPETPPTDASRGGEAAPPPVGDADPVQGFTPHERDEIAKDEVARARVALAGGDPGEALRALDRAEAHDPGNADIDALRRQAQASFARPPDAAAPPPAPPALP